jgi:hypothetical protein
VIAYTEFPGRLDLPGAPGWEKVADYVLSWALANAVPGHYAAPGHPR